MTPVPQVKLPKGPPEAMGRRIAAFVLRGWSVTLLPRGTAVTVTIKPPKAVGGTVPPFRCPTATAALHDAWIYACSADPTLAQYADAVEPPR